MKRFLQLHILTSYPPANLNRDDLGRPKTAKMGGVDRLRVSSQSLKRAWRTSELFKQALDGHIGTRTKLLGVECYKKLIEGGIDEGKAKDWSQKIAEQFGKLKKEEKEKPLADLEIEQLVHVSPFEQTKIAELLNALIERKKAPEENELNLLKKEEQAVDIALFGRMLASKTKFNIEAACQVAHAISVHPVSIEDDYFTAVDDLNIHREDVGSAHIGETGFAAALFYIYICIDREHLLKNLKDNDTLAKKAIAALTEAALTVTPTGKQNSFASRAYASYVLAETGDHQPRSLSVAYLRPIDQRTSTDFCNDAIQALKTQKENFDKVYDERDADASYALNAAEGKGKLQELLDFIQK